MSGSWPRRVLIGQAGFALQPHGSGHQRPFQTCPGLAPDVAGADVWGPGPDRSGADVAVGVFRRTA